MDPYTSRRDGDKVGPDKSPTSDMSRIIIDAGDVVVERTQFFGSVRHGESNDWFHPNDKKKRKIRFALRKCFPT